MIGIKTQRALHTLIKTAIIIKVLRPSSQSASVHPLMTSHFKREKLRSVTKCDGMMAGVNTF